MKEIEIKFPVQDLSVYRKKLQRTGAMRKAAFFEDNIVFDDEAGTLKDSEKLLRLRKSDRIALTFKTPVERSRFKVMDEHEVEVSDFDEANSILKALGYRQVFRYQKKREMYGINDVDVLLDETPIGNFIEIEGAKERITDSADLLGLSMEDGLSDTYRDLYLSYCRQKGIEPSDMVF
jgi:adenylate cyclase class 2